MTAAVCSLAFVGLVLAPVAVAALRILATPEADAERDAHLAAEVARCEDAAQAQRAWNAEGWR